MDGKIKRSRRSRSQRDRVRRKDAIDNVQNRSPSSGSDRGQSPFGNKALRNDGKHTNLHHDRPTRPLRKKRRGSGCHEEDIIDGFAISSFLSLDNLELALRKRTKSLRPHQGQERWERPGQERPGQERPAQERPGQQRPKPEKALAPVNGFHGNAPCNPGTPREEEKERGKMKVSAKKNKQGAKRSRSRAEVTRLVGTPQRSSSKDPHSETSFSGRGYSCDSESDLDDKVSGVDADKLFTLRITFESPADLQQTPEVSSTTTSSRVSGLQRSQEQINDTPFARPAPSPSPRPPGVPAAPRTPPLLPVCVKKERSSPNVPTPLQTLPGLAQIKREPQVPFSHPQALFSGLHGSHGSSLESSRKRPHPRSPHLGRHSSPSPALPLTITELPAPHYFLSGPGHRRTTAAMFPSLLSLPTNGIGGNPTGSGYSEHDLLRQELNNRFLAQSAERGGGAIPGPVKAQYHQHTHQHQHQHTFTPYPPCGPPPGILGTPSAPTMGRTATLNLEKYPVKLESPYSNLFPPYPSGTAGMPALLPHTAPFSSLQGAFQPKANPLDVVLRPGEMPQTLPRISDPFRASSRKPGKWCAMHGQVAWQIHHHQQRMRHMRFDPGKMSVKLDLFSRPAAAGPPPGLPYPQEMNRPLFPSSGLFPMSPFSSPYHHPHYLSTSHLPDPFSRPSPYGGFGNVASNAFGGLGAPSSSPYGERQGHGLPGFNAPPHDGWNRLHRTPPSFPTPPTLSRPADLEHKPAGTNSEQREAKKRDFTATREESVGDRSSQERKPQPNQSSFTSYQISSLIGGNSMDKKKSSLDQGPQAERVTKLLGKVQIKQSSSPGPEVQSRGPVDPSTTPTVKRQSPCEATPPLRGSVNIKQERREELELMAGTSNMTLLMPSVPAVLAHPHSQVPHPSRRNSYPNSGMFQGSHLPHSLPLSMGPLHSISSLSALERARVQPFMDVRERVPSHLPAQWEPLRDPYRGLYLQSQQPHLTFDPARGHRQREAQHHIQDRHRQAEERARLHQLQGSPMEGHLAHTPTFMSSLGGAVYPRLSPSAPHSGHLNRTPPTATLSAPPPPLPPPLVSTATPAVGGGPATPRKTTPTGSTPASGELAPLGTAKQVEAQ
ncbi:autism susceptibility gene 2 protein homolog isoform X2 [Hypomesus transpacificus]|uniref:autism susceptibility gene 2 protein homolog isoform X2 n=1 Tax=Hypomesus transpacificus TaxID=137520 RepID=UPI001F07C3DB|nr:autism susceptibility gene 2 protein homolog isoform X2 [Hypomesus transpacificus]